MTAIENVELPMILKGKLSPAERKSVAKGIKNKKINNINFFLASLEKVGMWHRLNQFPNKLSGGEQQRVTIARALGILNHLYFLIVSFFIYSFFISQCTRTSTFG